jgi:hypothetical protein
MCNPYRGPSIDASYQVTETSSPLKPLGQMNRNLVGSIYGRSSIKIAPTNQKQELPVVAMFVNGSGQNEHYL